MIIIAINSYIAIFLQDMDSEINSVLLNEMLEEDIISLSSGESDTELLQSDFGWSAKEDWITRPISIIDELMDGPPTHQTQHRHTSVTTPSALTSPPLPETSPPPTIPHQSSTTTPKCTSSNHLSTFISSPTTPTTYLNSTYQKILPNFAQTSNAMQSCPSLN